MRHWRTALLTTTLAAGPLVAQAQSAPPAPPLEGPYVSLGAGYNLLQDEFAQPRRQVFDFPNTRYRFGPGYVVAVSGGWGFGNGLRVELEGTYANTGFNGNVRTPLPGRPSGRQESYGGFVNAVYDVDLTKFGLDVSWVQPYLGVGAGALWTRNSPLRSAFADGSSFSLGGNAVNFAYQPIVGLGFPVEGVPGLKATLDYRMVGVIPNSGAIGTYITRAGTSRGTVGLSDVFNHQFTVGLSYALFTPPPSPPAPVQAAPAPAPARTYLVFFDWDRATLSDRARQIVAEAAQASTRVQTTRIEVNGYTDLSGTARYNQALSMRRARTVQAELMRDGVPAGEISIHGYGESNPLVPTADGVREPQNRRVQIVLR